MLTAEPVTLDGYVRRGVIGEIFPAIVEGDRHDHVAGVLYVGLDERAWSRLDRFEGELYERRRGEDRGRATPFTYVLGGAWRHRLGAEPWDPDAFARDHLDAFLARLAGAKGSARTRLGDRSGPPTAPHNPTGPGPPPFPAPRQGVPPAPGGGALR